jgi:hypothetical protein
MKLVIQKLKKKTIKKPLIFKNMLEKKKQSPILLLSSWRRVAKDLLRCYKTRRKTRYKIKRTKVFSNKLARSISILITS